MNLRVARVVAAAATAAAAVAGCAPSSTLTADPAPAAVTVGAGASPDSRVLAEIYAGVLRGAGSPVRTEPGLAGGEDLTALDAGTVTLVPEYTGELLLRLQPGASAITSDEVYEELNRSLPQGLSVSDPGSAQAPNAGDAGEEGGTRPALDVVPVMRTGVLTEPQIKALSVVAGELTSAELAAMTDSVDRGERTPEQAAADWLAARQ
ncbi:hypothetical protein GCM10023094_19830 [Rhodococcus olei]|uniref:ABC-type glycine betaine transport system substrate-binding domain-containing protein n=1 Tax=Rhodococcus olei TaxID=2161675 RepID=A0ABP8P1N9_9NOCA